MSDLITPQMDVDKTLQLFNQFEEIKSKLINEETDVVMINDNPYLTKTFWQKMMVVFNLSKEILSIDFIEKEYTRIVQVKVKVSAPNGRFSESIGIVTSRDKWAKGKSASAWVGMATTRAVNRCVQDLVSIGTLSYEEMIDAESGAAPNFTSFHRSIRALKINIEDAKKLIYERFNKQLKECSKEELDSIIHTYEDSREITF
jgi:hypothetical protein